MIQVFRSLYENASSLHIASHLAILAAIRDVCKLVVKELTSWVCNYINLLLLWTICFWPYDYLVLFIHTSSLNYMGLVFNYDLEQILLI